MAAVAFAALVGACGGTNPCKSGTILLTVGFDGATRAADEIDLDVSIAGDAPKRTTIKRAPNGPSGAVEISFPAGYPAGKRVDIRVVALAKGTPLAPAASVTITSLAPSCGSARVTLGAADGGAVDAAPDAPVDLAADAPVDMTVAPADVASESPPDMGAEASPSDLSGGETSGDGVTADAGDPGTCIPTTKQCATLSSVEVCGPTGTWNAPTPCTNQACAAGVCVGACTPGSMTCVTGANVTQLCSSSGQWGTAVACPTDKPTCSGPGVCGVCTIGAKKCLGNGVQTCGPDGQWTSAVACNMAACSNGACVGSCAPATTNCVGAKQQTCGADGMWSAAAVKAGACGAVCAPGGTQCTGPSNASQQTCDANGQWGTGVVVANACGAVCTPGTTQCTGPSNRTQQTCGTVGQWLTPGAVIGGQCGASCSPGATGCVGVNNATPRTCNTAGDWVNGFVTRGQCGAICDNTTRPTSCPGGNYNSYKCIGGQWVVFDCLADCRAIAPECAPTTICGQYGSVYDCGNCFCGCDTC